MGFTKSVKIIVLLSFKFIVVFCLSCQLKVLFGFQVNGHFWLSSAGRCNNNCSPDLGIESDHHSLAAGKMPSLDPLPMPNANGKYN